MKNKYIKMFIKQNKHPELLPNSVLLMTVLLSLADSGGIVEGVKYEDFIAYTNIKNVKTLRNCFKQLENVGYISITNLQSMGNCYMIDDSLLCEV